MPEISKEFNLEVMTTF